jgi:RNA polymerase sigma-70 factor (ECF subfamily)
MPQDDQKNDEERIIQVAISGDKQAFGRLYELYADQIYKYLFYRIGEHAKAVDMTEVVFLKAWENLPQFGSSGKGLNFRAWLYRIAHNAMVDHHRTKKERIALDDVPDLHDQTPFANDLIEYSEQLQELMTALDELDNHSRQVIVLRFFSGLDHKETARVMGISPGNVRIIQYRALKRLREYMGSYDE